MTYEVGTTVFAIMVKTMARAAPVVQFMPTGPYLVPSFLGALLSGGSTDMGFQSLGRCTPWQISMHLPNTYSSFPSEHWELFSSSPWRLGVIAGLGLAELWVQVAHGVKVFK